MLASPCHKGLQDWHLQALSWGTERVPPTPIMVLPPISRESREAPKVSRKLDPPPWIVRARGKRHSSPRLCPECERRGATCGAANASEKRIEHALASARFAQPKLVVADRALLAAAGWRLPRSLWAWLWAQRGRLCAGISLDGWVVCDFWMRGSRKIGLVSEVKSAPAADAPAGLVL